MGRFPYAGKVLPAVASGKIAPATIDDNVGRILRVMFESGVFDKPIASGQVDTPAHRALARKAARRALCCSRTRAASFR